MYPKSGQVIKKALKGIVTATVFVLLSITAWTGYAVVKEAPPHDALPNQDTVVQTTCWYFTLRNKVEAASNDEYYGGLRGGSWAGRFSVYFEPIPGLKEISDAAPFYIPGERIVLQGVNEMSESRMLEEIKGFSDNRQGNIVIYIHGYNIGFEKGCRHAAIFQRALNERHRVALFSWPADGDLLKYTRDEADLAWSVHRMADFFKTIVRLVGPGRVDVVAHSLGARGAAMALARIACMSEEGPFLNQLVLIAPDIDSDSFRDIWPDIRPLARRTTLYVSENDRALKLSQEVHGYPRLGEAGTHLTVLQGMETVDVSLTFNRRPSGHLYHLYTSEVVSDLAALLETGQKASKRANLKQVEMKGGAYWQVMPEKEKQPSTP